MKSLHTKDKKSIWLTLLGIFAGIVIIASLGGIWWYVDALQAKDVTSSEKISLKIDKGASASLVGSQLEDRGLIKSRLAFLIYMRLNDKISQVQAGVHEVSPNMSVDTIMQVFSRAESKQISVTFCPGVAVRNLREDPNKVNCPSVTSVLQKVGFSQTDIDTALEKKYSHPLLAEKPTTVGLDGYIGGDTYFVNRDAKPDIAITKALDHQYDILQKLDFASSMKQKGLTVHEGLTLASIVQKEVGDPKYQPQVAQVFYNRLDKGMMLGSDVTYQYIADTEGKARTTEYESPYNTRKYAGLPPGPIAIPGKSALEAVINPEKSDYLFFVAGDDGVTYFAKTLAEHEANAKAHCIKLCAEY